MNPSYSPKWILLVVVLSSLGLLAGCGSKKKVTTLYVATNGSDKWSGGLPAPNPEGSDGPLRTIPAARDRIRAARQADPSSAPAEVLIREGDYQISAPLVFEPQDSGTAGRPVTYSAYHGEHPRISGGTEITGWKKGSGNLWTAKFLRCEKVSGTFGNFSLTNGVFPGHERQTVMLIRLTLN